MMSTRQENYQVVVNHEGRYSIWLVSLDNPLEWRDTGEGGSKEKFLEYIKSVWVDMRRFSLSRAM